MIYANMSIRLYMHMPTTNLAAAIVTKDGDFVWQDSYPFDKDGAPSLLTGCTALVDMASRDNPGLNQTVGISAALRGPWAPATDPPVRPHRTVTRRLRLPFCRGGEGERGCPLATPREGDSTEGTRAELSSPALETAGASKAAERRA